MTNDWIVFEPEPGKKIAFHKQANGSKSFEEFSAHEAHHGLSKEQLKEVYGLCGGKVKATKAQTPAAPEE